MTRSNLAGALLGITIVHGGLPLLALAIGRSVARWRGGRSGADEGSDTRGWQGCAVGDLGTAEELLDRLERRGVGERALVVLGNSAFAVRWRER
jgi:hypothetical protein